MRSKLTTYQERLSALDKDGTRGGLVVLCGVALLLWTPLILKHWGSWIGGLSCVLGLSLPIAGIIVLLRGAKKIRK